MVFIWDDSTWKFVDKEDEYDAKRFVSVQKLFVTPNIVVNGSIPFNADSIRRFMRKYGEVVEIKFLNFKRPEAYVTFSNSSAAYIAFVDSLIFKSNLFKIQPADSWVQPSILPTESMDVADEEEDPLIFNLNDDCFYHIFKYLDFASLINTSEVCHRFATLTKSTFERTTELNIDFIIMPDWTDSMNISFKCPNGPIPALPLAQFRQYLKHIGEFVEEINFIAPTSIICRHHIQRYLVKIRQYAVARLKIIRFCDAVRCRELRFDY